MNKTLSFVKIIILSVFLLSCYNLNFLYGAGNDSSPKRLLRIKLIGEIGRLKRLNNKAIIEKLKSMAQEKGKLLKLYSMEGLYKNGKESYLLDILEFLNDQDPEIRIKTLEALGRTKNKSMQNIILRILKSDRDYYVRIAAVDALTALDSKNFAKEFSNALADIKNDIKQNAIFVLCYLSESSDMPFLKQLLKDNEREDYISRAYCAEALARLGDVSAVDILLKDLDDKNNSFRLLTAETLGKLNAGEDAAVRYAAKLKNKDTAEKNLSIRILGNLSTKNALPIIIEQTKDKDEFVRKEAAVALGDFKNRVDPSILETLLSLLNDNSEEVRSQAAFSLGTLYEKRTLENILKENLSSDEAKQTFLLSTGYGEKAATELRKLLNDNSNKVKGYAIRSLGLLEDKTSAFSIAEEFYNDDALLRQAAAGAIGRIKDSSTASRLIGLFNDPDKDVQVEAVKAAGLLEDKNLLSEILKKSGSGYIELETAVLTAAFQLGDSSIIDKCVNGIKDGDVASRAVSTQALGQIISTDETIKAIKDALNDKDPLVRLSAVKSLRLLENTASLSDIINMLNDRDREVRVEVCQALKCFKDHLAMAALKKILE